MKKYLLLILLLTFTVSNSFSQDTTYTTPFYKLKKLKEAELEVKEKKVKQKDREEEGSESSEYQRWLRFWQPRIAPNGTYKSYMEPVYNYYKTQNQRKQTGTSSILENMDAWKELGPYKKPNHGLPDNGGGELGVGIIRDMVINKQIPDKILAWSLAGGLFITDDKGVNWQNAGSDRWPRSGCSSADFSPVDPNTWYGCSNIGGSYYNNYIGNGGGVYRTTDAGLTWNMIADANSFSAGGASTIINKILISTVNPSIAYLATNSGLYKGIGVNGPNPSWSLIHNGHIEDMEFRTDNSGTLLISVKNASNVWTLEYTSNGGSNWSVLSPFPVISGSSTNRLFIEVSDAAPDLVFLLQLTTTNQTNLFNFNITTNSWQYKNTQPWQTGGPAFGVSNFNPNIIYLGNGIVFSKSINGGTSFVVHYGTPVTPANQFHPDIESIVTPPLSCTACANEVYICTHGGVSYSSDECATIVTRCDGLGIGQGNASNSATDPSKIIVGLDHDGTVLSSGQYGPNWIPDWRTVYGGDGMPPLIDYSDPRYVWASSQLQPHYLSSAGGMEYTYSPTIFAMSNDFTPHIYQNQLYPDIVYCREKDNTTGKYFENLWRANQRGSSGGIKEKISDFRTINFPSKPWPENPNFNYWMFTVHPTSNPNVTYLDLNTNGSDNGLGTPRWFDKLFRNNSMMAAASVVKNSWIELPNPVSPTTSIALLGVDINNSNIAYIGCNGLSGFFEIYRADYTNTTNPTFSRISGNPSGGGLPPVYTRTVICEKGSNGGLYAATEVGVFYSNNKPLDFSTGTGNNSQWVKVGTNLPNIPTNTLEINYVVNKLRASTAGRGVWEHDLYCPATNDYIFLSHPLLNDFFEAVNSIKSTAIIPAATIEYRAGAFIELNPGFSANPAANHYFSAFIHPCDRSGNSLIH